MSKKSSQRSPKIALVCDWLTTPGGAEKVLLELHKMYPDAPIYTSQYSKKGISWFDDAEVHTGWLQIFPSFLRKIMGPVRPLYFHFLNLSKYDIVISVTGAEAKGVKTKSKKHQAYHLCYCHVPTQYYWQFYDKYVKDPGFGVLNFFVRFCFKLLVKPLRWDDYRSASKVDKFLTISHYSASEIKKYYHRDATVVAPPVEVDKFYPKKTSSNQPSSNQRRGFIISCRQVTWKRVDLAITACIKAGVPLKVIGDGSEHERLVKLAQDSPLIEFYQWLDSAELARHLRSAKAYIFPSLEPFGIAAVEALAAGCPVIAFNGGGSKDFVIPGENGVLFDEQNVDSLVKAIKKFEKLQFNEKAITKSAERFSVSVFDKAMEIEVSQAQTIIQNNVKNKQTEVKS